MGFWERLFSPEVVEPPPVIVPPRAETFSLLETWQALRDFDDEKLQFSKDEAMFRAMATEDGLDLTVLEDNGGELVLRNGTTGEERHYLLCGRGGWGAVFEFFQTAGAELKWPLNKPRPGASRPGGRLRRVKALA